MTNHYIVNQKDRMMKYCPKCGIGLSNQQVNVGYCTNCKYDFGDELRKESKEWDGRCRCGHLHSEHNPIQSINYSAGRCTVGECRCAHFIHEPDLIAIPLPSGTTVFRWEENAPSKDKEEKTERMFTLEDLAKSHWRGWFVRERYTGPDRHGYEEKLPKNWGEMDYDEHEEWFFSQFVKETFAIDISNK